MRYQYTPFFSPGIPIYLKTAKKVDTKYLELLPKSPCPIRKAGVTKGRTINCLEGRDPIFFKTNNFLCVIVCANTFFRAVTSCRQLFFWCPDSGLGWLFMYRT